MIFLSDADVRAVFDWKAAIAALRSAYAAPMVPTMSPPRAIASANGVWLRTMTGIAPQQQLMGSKSIAFSSVDRRVSYLISLFDTRTAVLEALLDGSAITGFRTAATSAVALDALVPQTSLRVGVIGSGFEAERTSVPSPASARLPSHASTVRARPAGDASWRPTASSRRRSVPWIRPPRRSTTRT